MNQQSDKQRPVAEFRSRNIQASIWKSEVEKDGRAVPRYSVRIEKRYRKDNGSYETTNCFFPEELPRLQLLAQKAFEYTTLTSRTEVDEAVPV
jgi:hypothetical protein